MELIDRHVLKAVSVATSNPESVGVDISPATAQDRAEIYRIRHDVYALELGQHPPNAGRRLADALDENNTYLVARGPSRLRGFISITDPTAQALSIEKYVHREALPFELDSTTFEIRLLTVPAAERGSGVATALMCAALDFVRAAGGTRIVAMGRRELLEMYRTVGLQTLGIEIKAGAVAYEVMSVSVADLPERAAAPERDPANTPAPRPSTDDPVGCFHGGAFFDAVGTDFATLERSTHVINADVLDAWFPPAPAVLDALTDYLPWLARTSPPTDSEGLRRAVAARRDVPEDSLLLGAGSSALIFLAFGRWLNPRSRVLITDPTYGEYAHVLERVVGCQVDRLPLDPEADFDLDLERLVTTGSRGYDLIVLVNPNSPTGRHADTSRLRTALSALPASTRVWVDETYIDFAASAAVSAAANAAPGAGSGQVASLERWATTTSNVTVAKSMSKAYALSGLRVAYLCAGPSTIAALRSWTPPWAVSLPAQVAAVRALESSDYYRQRWEQTAALRRRLGHDLQAIGLDVVPATANFLLARLPDEAPAVRDIVAACRRQDVFVRDATNMGTQLERYVRLAVKDERANRLVTAALVAAMSGPSQRWEATSDARSQYSSL